VSELAKEIEEIIDYAKGNFFPTSNILRHALVVAKKIQDEKFEMFVTNELKGYKSGPLPSHRKIRGMVVLVPSFGAFQRVDLRKLEAEAIRKVSTAHVAETIPIIENTINFQGDDGFFTVGFSSENEGVLAPTESGQIEYGILLQNMQMKELLDEVRGIIFDWAIERQRDLLTTAELNPAPAKPQKLRSRFLEYLKDNKQWIFSGVGVLALIVLGGVVIHFVTPPRDSGTTAEATALTTQRETLEVPRLGDFEVFYPKPFTSIPNLTFNKKIGSVYIGSEYEVLEQRKDGFKIRMLSIADGRAIEWIAVGPTK
jgi:hypothetical protein